MIGDEAVAEARSWVGTPFKWQGSAKGYGADCMGLICGVARGIGHHAEASIARWNYSDSKPVPADELKSGLATVFDKVDDPAPGDIMLMRLAGMPQHMAIYCGRNRMIHAYFAGPERVIEVSMGNVWWTAIDSVWRWRCHCQS